MQIPSDASGRKLLRLRDVMIRTSLSKSTIRRLEDRREFPFRARIGTIAVWDADAIDRWIEQRLESTRASEAGKRAARDDDLADLREIMTSHETAILALHTCECLRLLLMRADATEAYHTLVEIEAMVGDHFRSIE